jgi:DNA-binding NarL/FixJ family response regulator
MTNPLDRPAADPRPGGPPLAPRRPLTHTQLATLRAYLAGGSIKAAARSLQVPEATVRSRLHSARRRTGLPSLAHLAYWVDR